MIKLISKLPIDHFKQRLHSLVIPKLDNHKSKFTQFIKMDYPSELVGEIKLNSFHVWTYEGGRSGTGPFYPVIDCNYNQLNNQTVLKISVRMNIVGKTILVIIMTFLAWVIITFIIIQEDNSVRFVIWRTLAGLVLFTTFMAVPFFSYQHLKNRIIEFLSNELELKKFEN